MNEDPFKSKQERSSVRIEVATPRYWKEFKKLRLEAVTGRDAKMFGVNVNTPEKLAQEVGRTDLQWQEELVLKDKFTILAWAGKEAIGMGRAERFEKLGVWYMFAGYVRPEFRGGLGKKIFAKRLKEIIKQGGGIVRMRSKTYNSVSIGLAESFGFSKKFEDTSDDEVVMELRDLKSPEVVKKIEEVLNTKLI